MTYSGARGAALLTFALVKRSRTRLAPMHTNISTNSEPGTAMNGTPASTATARARRVLPVPEGGKGEGEGGKWQANDTYEQYHLGGKE